MSGTMAENDNEWAKNVVENSGKKIAKSDVFCSIFTNDYMKDPQCALELGISLLMDKPIVLVVKEGTSIPKRLKQIAECIEFFKGADDIGLATERAVKFVKENP